MFLLFSLLPRGTSPWYSVVRYIMHLTWKSPVWVSHICVVQVRYLSLYLRIFTYGYTCNCVHRCAFLQKYYRGDHTIWCTGIYKTVLDLIKCIWEVKYYFEGKVSNDIFAGSIHYFPFNFLMDFMVCILLYFIHVVRELISPESLLLAFKLINHVSAL